jgi:hypothetical protein
MSICIPFRRWWCEWKDNIEKDVRERGRGFADWIKVVWDNVEM